MRERQDPLEFDAPSEPPPLTPGAAKLLAEFVRRAVKLDSADDSGSSAA